MLLGLVLRKKEKEMQAVLREILGYILFLYLLFAISYGSKDPATYQHYTNLRNVLQHGSGHMYGPMTEGPGYDFVEPVPLSSVGILRSTYCLDLLY